MFDIILKKPSIIDEYGNSFIPSKLIINDFIEYLQIPINFWSIDNYIESWIKSISAGFKKNKDTILITGLNDNPENLNFIQTWVIYFNKDYSSIQNIILFLNEYPDFNIDEPNETIPTREIYDEDGMKISEWVIKNHHIDDFYEKLVKIKHRSCGK